jgi:hypothetical protein
MARIAWVRSRNARGPNNRLESNTEPATVASMGMQGRLVRVDAEREHELAHLLHRYQCVRAGWDRVIRQTLDLLNRHQSASAGANVENAPAQNAHAGDDRTAPSHKSLRVVIAPDAGLETA